MVHCISSQASHFETSKADSHLNIAVVRVKMLQIKFRGAVLGCPTFQSVTGGMRRLGLLEKQVVRPTPGSYSTVHQEHPARISAHGVAN